MSREHGRYAFILVSDEKYWNRLCERNKANKKVHAFVRRNQVGPVQTNKLLFYVIKPAMTILGTADFLERLTGDCQELWSKYGVESCFENFNEYYVFAQGRQKMTFIRFTNLTELAEPKPTETVRSHIGSMHWFRGRYINQEMVTQLTT